MAIDPTAAESVLLCVDPARRYQTIDGFGMNINSKCWNNGKLIPVMDLLTDDLGTTIFRLDAYGKSNWIDPEGKGDATWLNPKRYAEVYAGIDFQNAVAMCRYLNGKGIEPYVTLSGVVPPWMCEADCETLKRFDLFAEMAGSYAKWLRGQDVRFSLFGPLNETDFGPPEGPRVTPANYAKAMEAIVETFDRQGLTDIRFVAPEQSKYNLDYVHAIAASPRVAARMAVVGMHAYADFHADSVVNYLPTSSLKHARPWMTEYGDLDQTGEREWDVARAIYRRLMRLLDNGYTAALNWDAFDNYHDHDECWTIFGLIRFGWRLYTPKRRYHAVKQMYRFVRPGFTRIHADAAADDLKVQAYLSPDGMNLTVTGMNDSTTSRTIRLDVRALPEPLRKAKFSFHRTGAEENCAPAQPAADDPTGSSYTVPPHSIFTITTVCKV